MGNVGLVVPKQQPAAPVATVYPFPPGRAIFIAPTESLSAYG